MGDMDPRTKASGPAYLSMARHGISCLRDGAPEIARRMRVRAWNARRSNKKQKRLLSNKQIIEAEQTKRGQKVVSRNV